MCILWLINWSEADGRFSQFCEHAQKKAKPNHKAHSSYQFQYSGMLRPVDFSKNTRAFNSSEKQHPFTSFDREDGSTFSFETLTRINIPEQLNLQQRFYESLRSLIILCQFNPPTQNLLTFYLHNTLRGSNHDQDTYYPTSGFRDFLLSL